MVTNIRGLFCNRHLVHLPKPCQSRYQRRSLNEEACTYLPRGFFFPTSVAYACSDVHLKGNTCLDKVHPKTFSSCKRHHTNNLVFFFLRQGWVETQLFPWIFVQKNKCCVFPTSEKGEKTVASGRDEGSGGIRRSAIEPDCLRSRFSV